MIMQEVLARTGRGVSGRVFGTDINSEAVDVGRRAFYPARIRNEVSRARLSRFFSSRGGKFRVRPALRPMVIFGQQNVLTDPPIIDLDVLICRNLLIYFDVPTRERILAVFHYALRPGALLMLGTACNIAGESQLFSPVEGSRCVYRRNQDLHGQRTPMWPAVAANARLRRSRPVADSTAGVEADRKAQRLDGSERRSETVQELVNMNEQLETSKEELASLNEELRLTNNALALQVERSTKAQDDLSNLVRYAGLAAVFVSNDLRILRFTEPMRPFMPLRPSDVGRPLSDIAHTLKYERFIEDAREAVESLQVKETATTMGDTSVLVRMSPYQTGENSVDGLLIAFVSVDAFVRSLAAAGSGLRARAGSLEDGLILLGK